MNQSQDEPLSRPGRFLRPLVRRINSRKVGEVASKTDRAPIDLFFRPRQISKLEQVPLPWAITGL